MGSHGLFWRQSFWKPLLWQRNHVPQVNTHWTHSTMCFKFGDPDRRFGYATKQSCWGISHAPCFRFFAQKVGQNPRIATTSATNGRIRFRDCTLVFHWDWEDVSCDLGFNLFQFPATKIFFTTVQSCGVIQTHSDTCSQFWMARLQVPSLWPPMFPRETPRQ